MARKRTNLAVAVDVPTAAEMLRIADQARAAAGTSPVQDARCLIASLQCGRRCELQKRTRLHSKGPPASVVIKRINRLSAYLSWLSSLCQTD